VAKETAEKAQREVEAMERVWKEAELAEKARRETKAAEKVQEEARRAEGAAGTGGVPALAAEERMVAWVGPPRVARRGRKWQGPAQVALYESGHELSILTMMKTKFLDHPPGRRRSVGWLW
jgi:hypothetical protein